MKLRAGRTYKVDYKVEEFTDVDASWPVGFGPVVKKQYRREEGDSYVCWYSYQDGKWVEVNNATFQELEKAYKS